MKYISKLRVKELLKNYAKRNLEQRKQIIQLNREIDKLTEVSLSEIIFYTITGLFFITLTVILIIHPEYFLTTWR